MGLPKSIDYSQCIYGLHVEGGPIRYVGHTRYAAERLALHKLRARKHTHDHLPVYQWMHEEGPENIKVTILVKFTGDWDIDNVCAEEKRQIALWRSVNGELMTNLSDGGFESHLPSMLRGEAHPLFGHKMDDDHKKALQDGRIRFFQNMTDEEREAYSKKMTEAQKKVWESRTDEEKVAHMEKTLEGLRAWKEAGGKQRTENKGKGPHVRHHVNKGVKNLNCKYCFPAAA